MNLDNSVTQSQFMGVRRAADAGLRLGKNSDDGYYLVHLFPNRIVFFDLQRLAAASEDHEDIATSLLLPKKALEDGFPWCKDLHQLSLSESDGPVETLVELMGVMAARLPNLTVQDAHQVMSAVVGLVLEFVNRPTKPVRPQRPSLCVERIEHYIHQNLGKRDLTVQSICQKIGLSRSQLFRLFAPHGGVSRYIREQRLLGAFRELSGGSTRRIFEVAVDWGFASEAHFCRLFREQFGVTPGHARLLETDVLHSANVTIGSLTKGHIKR